ncbi:hypothetical protein M404DRAFT_608424 [Pisolithus tinctorius Marx 270]|uniref:Uncharacterized protein n=1 Tax=Pisolithus tinctorius Marx 270 TaxID=870435 RepID=A0A0C3J487_PISTI|nr:hypothetical protein M404DRAFT_608424 [Pisolithus tinctorius Marx 270]
MCNTPGSFAQFLRYACDWNIAQPQHSANNHLNRCTELAMLRSFHSILEKFTRITTTTTTTRLMARIMAVIVRTPPTSYMTAWFTRVCRKREKCQIMGIANNSTSREGYGLLRLRDKRVEGREETTSMA